MKMNIKKIILSILLILTSSFISAQFLPSTLEKTPGYVNPEDATSCFSFMGPVKFDPAYKWITAYVGSRVDGWTGGLLNLSSERLYGFSIPLVGDLTGDGIPEVVTMGLADGSIGLYSNNTYIYIYNGQTGRGLKKFTLPLIWSNRDVGYHGSPSNMVLVDVDPSDDKKEIIMALGNGTGTFGRKVICWSIDKDLNFTLRWISSDTYNTPRTSDFIKPLPQVVDLDGDGIPEVIVYNKVYNARTGELICTLETLGSNAFVGRDVNARVGDNQIPYSYIYDIDGDGIYDIIAGGKVYKMAKNANGTFSYSVIELSGLGDGMASVADINDDGIPDIIVAQRNTGTDITVYNVLYNDATSSYEAKKIAGCNIPFLNGLTNQGSSYIYVGDIDGKINNGKRYPEIALLSGRLERVKTSAMLHPNFDLSQFPTSGSYIPNTTSSSQGTLAAVTFDETVSDINNNLKISFILEHKDSSAQTGFTMFDFDNDGVKEICYRDESTLRIIKATRSYIPNSATVSANGPILFQKAVRSFTGFEYPVIADVDNDASAEMIVMGHDATGNVDYSFLYNVGANGDKFAPALPVWNQFMYDPFKINPDLSTPVGPAPNRLSNDYVYTQIIRDENGNIKETINNYNPYNATLNQVYKFQMSADGYEPLVYLTEAYIVGATNADTSKRPKVITASGTSKIEVYIGNKASALTNISSTTPITIYKGSVSAANFYKKVTLADLSFNSSINPGEEIKLEIPVNDPNGYYIMRLGDSSDFTDVNNPKWKWGVNNPNINDLGNKVGSVDRANRDCDWTDQIAVASVFQVVDYVNTIQEYSEVTIDILNDNVILQDPSSSTFVSLVLTNQPSGGIIEKTGSGASTKLVYRHTNKAVLPNSIEEIGIDVTYNIGTLGQITRSAKIYLFVLQPLNASSGCYGYDLDVELLNPQNDVDFYWYKADEITEEGTNPKSSFTINNLSTIQTYKIQPKFKSITPYNTIAFPKGEFVIRPIGDSSSSVVNLTWSGAISTNWRDPNNWVLSDGTTSLVAPAGCVDVVIPKVTTNYPIIDNLSEVNSLFVKDRAMLKNVHNLETRDVVYEFIPKTSELNRWLSLAAPLDNMYSGDYILLDNSGNQIPEASYISYFQSSHPDDNTAAKDKSLTRPFGKIEEKLSLNKPFFLYLDEDYLSAIGKSFSAKYLYPTGKNTYTYNYNSVVGGTVRQKTSNTLIRSANNKEKFSLFVDGTLNVPTGEFSATYTGGKILYVANPFPAMMNVEAFVLANSDVLTGEYKIWDGTLGDFVIRTTSNASAASTFEIKSDATFNTATSSGQTLVAPFQGFFVKLKNGTSATLKFKSEDTQVNVVDYEY